MFFLVPRLLRCRERGWYENYKKVSYRKTGRKIEPVAIASGDGLQIDIMQTLVVLYAPWHLPVCFVCVESSSNNRNLRVNLNTSCVWVGVYRGTRVSKGFEFLSCCDWMQLEHWFCILSLFEVKGTLLIIRKIYANWIMMKIELFIYNIY